MVVAMSKPINPSVALVGNLVCDISFLIWTVSKRCVCFAVLVTKLTFVKFRRCIVLLWLAVFCLVARIALSSLKTYGFLEVVTGLMPSAILVLQSMGSIAFGYANTAKLNSE